MKSHTLNFFAQSFLKSSSITYLNDSKSFKVTTCHDQRHWKESLTGKNKLWIQNTESILNITFRIVFKNKHSFGSSAQVTEKAWPLCFLFTMTLSQKQWFPDGHFPYPASATSKSRWMFLFWYNTKDGALWWRPINGIFSPAPMGKERLMGIRDLGLFVLKDSKELFLKISYCLEYGFSLWKVHTNWNTWVIFKWVTEIKELKKIMWLALVGYERGSKALGDLGEMIPPGSTGFSLAKWITRSPSTCIILPLLL